MSMRVIIDFELTQTPELGLELTTARSQLSGRSVIDDLAIFREKQKKTKTSVFSNGYKNMDNSRIKLIEIQPLADLDTFSYTTTKNGSDDQCFRNDFQ